MLTQDKSGFLIAIVGGAIIPVVMAAAASVFATKEYTHAAGTALSIATLSFIASIVFTFRSHHLEENKYKQNSIQLYNDALEIKQLIYDAY